MLVWWRASVLGVVLWLCGGPLGGSCCMTALVLAHIVLLRDASGAGQDEQGVHRAGVV